MHQKNREKKIIDADEASKVITDYVSESTLKLRYRMETKEAQEEYKNRMPHSESKFTYNKHNLHYK